MTRLLVYALLVLDCMFVFAAVAFGWRPFSRVLRRIWSRVIRFLLVFFGTLIGLTIAIPWIDAALYDAGYQLNNDYIIFLAPAFVLTLSLTAAIAVIWELERRS